MNYPDDLEYLPENYGELVKDRNLFLAFEYMNKPNHKYYTKKILDGKKTYLTSDIFIDYLHKYLKNNQIFRYFVVSHLATHKCMYYSLKIMLKMCNDLKINNAHTIAEMLCYDYSDNDLCLILDNKEYIESIYNFNFFCSNVHGCVCHFDDEVNEVTGECTICEEGCVYCYNEIHKNCVTDGKYSNCRYNPENQEDCTHDDKKRYSTANSLCKIFTFDEENNPSIYTYCITNQKPLSKIEQEYGYDYLGSNSGCTLTNEICSYFKP